MTDAALVTLVPTWRAALEVLRRGGSSLVHAPRHYGQEWARRAACATHQALGFSACAVLQMRGGEAEREEPWPALARTVADRLGVPQPNGVEDARALARFVQAHQPPYPRRVLFVASIAADATTAPLWFDLVSAFVEVLTDEASDHPRLSLFATDDYSLYYYEALRTRNQSTWDILERRHHPPLGVRELATIVDKLAPEAPEWLVPRLHLLSGGHPGLALSLTSAQLAPSQWKDEEEWSRTAEEWLAGSGAMESIRRVLSEDATTLCREALKYAVPSPPRDHGNLPLQVLRRHGVVNWTLGARARLAPGLIGQLVHEFASASDAQDSAAEADAWGVEDDDLVVLHLSDLHVGPAFPFRYDFAAGQQLDRPCLASSIASDVDRLGLAGRIDAVVVSGDFTDRGEMGEFRRAREVLRELLRLLDMPWERVVVVAGNHDLQWTPGVLDLERARSGASREAYLNFRDLIGRGDDPGVEITTIYSRSRRRAVQVVSLDSNYVEGSESGGMGYVAPAHLRAAAELLAADTRSLTPGTARSVWLVMHHHVLPVSAAGAEQAERRRVSVTGNATEVLAFAAAHGVDFILHGHEHQPCLLVEQRWPSEAGTWRRPVVVLGAGSVGGSGQTLGPFRRNHYFIIHQRAAAAYVRSRMLGDHGLSWVSHDDVHLSQPRRTHAAPDT